MVSQIVGTFQRVVTQGGKEHARFLLPQEQAFVAKKAGEKPYEDLTVQQIGQRLSQNALGDTRSERQLHAGLHALSM